MDRKTITALISAGWHLRDWFVHNPEQQVKPKEVEIDLIAQGFFERLKNGENNGKALAEFPKRDRDHNCCVWFNPGRD